ncbi:hypothetical protein LXG23DRAFT_38843 [Yarrowia lipolytica]|nr:hypothetical protein LXG23DRAFT_38843 [Yarrowia lipolytica]
MYRQAVSMLEVFLFPMPLSLLRRTQSHAENSCKDSLTLQVDSKVVIDSRNQHTTSYYDKLFLYTLVLHRVWRPLKGPQGPTATSPTDLAHTVAPTSPAQTRFRLSSS